MPDTEKMPTADLKTGLELERELAQEAATVLDRNLIAICRDGVPLVGPKGEAVIVDGKPVMRPASAAYYKQLKDWLRDRTDILIRAGVRGDPKALQGVGKAPEASPLSGPFVRFKGQPIKPTDDEDRATA